MSIKKPWLLIPAKWSHSLGPKALRFGSKFKRMPHYKSTEVSKLGLKFSSPFGTAGGLDKEAKDLSTWSKWGAGFLEIGTFTPLPQGPNPGNIIGRDNQKQALWNCMGFPNAGFEKVLPRIQKFKDKTKTSTPVFINIGKNRTTPLNEAEKDYVKGIHFFNEVADAFVINISSPNTKDLRLLHQKENFKKFITPIIEASKSHTKKTPLLVKLSPDLNDKDFCTFISDSLSLEIDGFILTNTTSSRPDGLDFPKRGGVSGLPLRELSMQKLKLAKKIMGENSTKVIISVGGICTPFEAMQRIKAGADLVQFYSGLIFYGPALFKDSIKEFQTGL